MQIGVGVIAVGAAVAFWFVTGPKVRDAIAPVPPVVRTFPATGIKTVILRAGSADTAEILVDERTTVVEVSGIPGGGAKGYHSPDRTWKETTAADWGLDFTAQQFGDKLVISTTSEIAYIHHLYTLKTLVLKIPPGVKVIREPRDLTGDGKPDLREPVADK